jgi:hypothetical protein
VFTAWYALSPYIKHIRFVLKGLSNLPTLCNPLIYLLQTRCHMVSHRWICINCNDFRWFRIRINRVKRDRHPFHCRYVLQTVSRVMIVSVPYLVRISYPVYWKKNACKNSFHPDSYAELHKSMADYDNENVCVWYIKNWRFDSSPPLPRKRGWSVRTISCMDQSHDVCWSSSLSVGRWGLRMCRNLPLCVGRFLLSNCYHNLHFSTGCKFSVIRCES